jgi:DMSO/TMAO reductase YedYZ heme-binding membrane subunit
MAYLAAAGMTEENILSVLRWSARAAFLLLMLVFVARPLQHLLKKPWTAKLLRNRRLIGIAFAGLHTAHLGFILLRGRISEDFVFDPTENLAGTLVYTVILAMLVTSWDSTTRLLGRRNWKILHTVGLYVLFVAFTDAVRPYSLASAAPINWLLLAIAVSALLIRLAAYPKRRLRARS